MADLSDLEDQKETHHHLVLYEAALLELTHGNIPCRTLRSVLKIYNDYVYRFVYKSCIIKRWTEVRLMKHLIVVQLQGSTYRK